MRAQGAPQWPRRGTAARLVLSALTGLCVFGSHAYAQTGMAEPYLFGDWGGTRTRLQDQGVRFDFQYVSDTLWGFKSEQTPFAMWNRFRATVDIDFGALAGLDGWYFHATGLAQGGGNLGQDLGLLTGPSGLVSANTTRLDSWWIEKRWLDERIAVRVGQFAGPGFLWKRSVRDIFHHLADELCV